MPPAAPTTDSADLDVRYGRDPRSRRRERGVLIALGAVVTAAVLGWVAWAGLSGTWGELESRTLTHQDVDDRTFGVTIEVTADADSAVRCAVEVQNSDHAVVGFTTVELPAGSERTRRSDVVVRTTERGVTGLINRCWLP